MLAESVRWPTLTTSCCFCSVDARPKRAADTQHPFGYGYGQERYVYAFVVSIILFSVSGVFSIYEGIHNGLFSDHGRGSRTAARSRGSSR